jgi:hypothetical protein
VPRRIFGPERDEKLHNGEFFSKRNCNDKNSRKMGWAGHVACMRGKGMPTGLVGEARRKEGDH